MQNRQKRQASISSTQNTTVPSHSHLFFTGRRLMFVHSRQLTTIFPSRIRMRQFFPGIKKTLHFLQKRLRHCTGIFVLDFAASFRAAVITFLAPGCIAACSNNAATSLADALGFTPILERIKLYKHLVKK